MGAYVYGFDYAADGRDDAQTRDGQIASQSLEDREGCEEYVLGVRPVR